MIPENLTDHLDLDLKNVPADLAKLIGRLVSGHNRNHSKEDSA